MNEDEPLFHSVSGEEESPAGDEHLPERIRHLMASQPFAVLCTQGDAQPYGSLVAFAFSDDLRSVVFATPVATRKYRLLSGCVNVALVIDNRSIHGDQMMRVEAITATGRAARLASGPDWDAGAGLLIARHPNLKRFVHSSSSALFRIDIIRYLHVSRFQEVRQWLPRSR